MRLKQQNASIYHDGYWKELSNTPYDTILTRNSYIIKITNKTLVTICTTGQKGQIGESNDKYFSCR